MAKENSMAEVLMETGSSVSLAPVAGMCAAASRLAGTDVVAGVSERRRANIARHPCYGGGCHGSAARMHLAVAPRCNISCGFCRRDFDCVNESRPGVSSAVLTPAEAQERFLVAREQLGDIAVVGIAGPGDPLANWEETRETFRLVRAVDDDVAFCLSTNGLLLPGLVEEIRRAGVSHLTVTVNAVDPQTGAQIYGNARWRGKVLSGVEGARVLLENQLEGIRAAAQAGLVVKVNTVLVDGVNVDHAPAIAKRVADLGAACHNVNSMIPVEGTPLAGVAALRTEQVAQTRQACSVYLEQILHCRQCRADAVGTLGCDVARRVDELVANLRKTESGLSAEADTIALDGRTAEAAAVPDSAVKAGNSVAGVETAGTAVADAVDSKAPSKRIAVATSNGVQVDVHFGHASRFHVYDADGAGVRFVKVRAVKPYCHGPAACGEGDRSAFDALGDCDAVVCSRAGGDPRNELEKRGVRVFDAVRPASSALAAACAGGSVKRALEEAYRLLS